MGSARHPLTTVCEASTDPQLARMLARRDHLGDAIEHRAAEVVRTWLIDHNRTWLAVDFTRAMPEPPFDGEAGLVAAVVNLPGQVFGSGLDVRGSFIIRLSDLNTLLGYRHDDQTQPVAAPSKTVAITWVEESHHRAVVRVRPDFDPDEYDLANGLAELSEEGFEFVERAVVEIRDDDADPAAPFLDLPCYVGAEVPA